MSIDSQKKRKNAYKKDAFHNQIISLQVFIMLTTGQLQLLPLPRVNQNAAIVAMIIHRRRKWRQYWLRPWIARRPWITRRSIFLGLLHTIFELFEHLLRNDTVIRRQVGDVCKHIADWRRTHGNHFATDSPPVANKAQIELPHHWSVTDRSLLHC